MLVNAGSMTPIGKEGLVARRRVELTRTLDVCPKMTRSVQGKNARLLGAPRAEPSTDRQTLPLEQAPM
jgi:hypothetical protein